MDTRGYQHYKEQSVNTMTQGELLLLLYDELVKRLTQAELALGKQNYDLFEASVQRGCDIVAYLDGVLDHTYPISKELAQMYEYFTYELGRAKIGRNAEVLAHIKKLSMELRDAFRQADKNAESGKDAGQGHG